MEGMVRKFRASYKLFFLAIAILLAGGIMYAIFKEYSLSAELSRTQALHASSTEQFERRVSELGEHLVAIEERNTDLRNALSEAQDDIKAVERRFGNVTDTVEELEKLTKADPKLLQKYSKIFFLNEHYEPERLVEIGPEYRYHEDRLERIHASVWPFLEELIDDAKEDGVEMYVKSAYRSFDEQESLKNAYTVTYGAGSANQFSADQGYSEHQLGTTADFITTGLGGQLTGFESTAAYQWLVDNAYKYGFILSYPQGNQYYVYEPWHWRFVGEDLAEELHDEEQNFYDLEQREIDEYLPGMFD